MKHISSLILALSVLSSSAFAHGDGAIVALTGTTGLAAASAASPILGAISSGGAVVFCLKKGAKNLPQLVDCTFVAAGIAVSAGIATLVELSSEKKEAAKITQQDALNVAAGGEAQLEYTSALIIQAQADGIQDRALAAKAVAEALEVIIQQGT